LDIVETVDEVTLTYLCR